MAITNIEIVQDNIVGDCDLLSVASPLVYLVNATYTGAVPDVIYAKLFDGVTYKDYYKCLPWVDLSSTVRQFWFKADEILRQYVPLLEDVTQADNTLIEIDGAVKALTFQFANEYRDDIGTCYKEGNLEGLVLPNPNYFINFGVEINGVPYVMNFFIPEPMTLTNAYMIERFIEQLNIYAPGAYGASVLVAASAYGFRITNNTTSDPDSITVSSIGGVTQEASFPVAVISAFTNFHAINAAGQLGETEANLHVCNNEAQNQIGIVGKHAYAYFYDSVGTGIITATQNDSVAYEMTNITDGVLSGHMTATQISASVVRYKSELSGGAVALFGASGNYSKLEIKIDAIDGNFDELNVIRLTWSNNGTQQRIIDGFGAGVHEFIIDPLFNFSSLRLIIDSADGLMKSIDLDYIRLTSGLNPCSNG